MSKTNYISIGAALIVFASVATALRFDNMPLGIGEVTFILVFFWALRYRQPLRYLKHPIMLFWIGFITIAAMARLLSTVEGASATHTAMAYVYSSSFSLIALACLDQASRHQFEGFIKALVLIPGIMLVIPFLCFLTDATRLAEFFRINTDFPSRLSAWSTNPNQLGLLLLPIPFWLMAVRRDAQWQGVRWLRNFTLLWAFFLLGICVRSDALLLAWCAGLPLLTGIAAVWVKPFNWRLFGSVMTAFVLAFASFKVMIDGPGREQLIRAESVVIEAATKLLGKPSPEIGEKPFAPSKSDSVIGVGFDQNKSGVRRTLWVHAYEAWLQSPFIGNGPGAFSYLDDPAQKQEAHNLSFDLLTQAGMVGVLMFAALYLWLFSKAYQARDPYSLVILVVLMLFSGAHFMLRQPIFSLYMILCALAVKHGIFNAMRDKPQPT